MSKTPMSRIAHVQLSPKGKSYAMRCNREDILEGHEVEVLMYEGTERAYYDDGLVTSISHHRWNCSCSVVNHTSEVDYTIELEPKFLMKREVDLSKPPKPRSSEWRSQKQEYYANLPEPSRGAMNDIYDAISNDDGEDAYLGDGIWVSPDGNMEDRGR